MQLIDDWKRKFPRLWSVRLSLLAAVASGVQVGFGLLATGQTPVFAAIAGVCSAAAAVARIIAQPAVNET